MVVGCQNTAHAQNITPDGAGAFSLLPITGASNTSTTTLSGNGDSVFFKATIPATGDLTICLTLLAAANTYSVTGTAVLYGSMDGTNYVQAAASLSLSAAATIPTPTSAGAATFTNTIGIAWSIPEHASYTTAGVMTSVNGTVTSGGSVPRYKYYIVKLLQTTAATSSSVASCKWGVSRSSPYK